MKDYYTQNKEALLNQKKEYYKTHKEEVLNKVKAYYKISYPKHKARYIANDKKRKVSKMNRTPKWLTETDIWMMQEIYELAELRTRLTGISWHVDHIIPLQGRKVSGLHTPNNLQVIPATQNLSKGNRYDHRQSP